MLYVTFRSSALHDDQPQLGWNVVYNANMRVDLIASNSQLSENVLGKISHGGGDVLWVDLPHLDSGQRPSNAVAFQRVLSSWVQCSKDHQSIIVLTSVTMTKNWTWRLMKLLADAHG